LPGAKPLLKYKRHHHVHGHQGAGCGRAEEVPFRFSFDASGNLLAGGGGLQESGDAAQKLKTQHGRPEKPG